MHSPARAHFLHETARLAAEADTGISLENMTVYQQLLKKLYEDKIILKALRSQEDKASAKADMLPKYAEWVLGVMQGDNVQPEDKITPTVLVWTIDCGLLDQVMPLADFAMQTEMHSTDDFARDMPELIIEQMAEQITAGYTITGDNLKTLVEWATAKDGDLHRYNLNDNVRAKLLKAAGEWAEDQELRDYALHLYELAAAYNPRIGVKKRIDALSKSKG